MPRIQLESNNVVYEYIFNLLANLFQEIFKFCQSKSEREKIELDDGFAVAFGLKQPKVCSIQVLKYISIVNIYIFIEFKSENIYILFNLGHYDSERRRRIRSQT